MFFVGMRFEAGAPARGRRDGIRSSRLLRLYSKASAFAAFHRLVARTGTDFVGRAATKSASTYRSSSKPSETYNRRHRFPLAPVAYTGAQPETRRLLLICKKQRNAA